MSDSMASNDPLTPNSRRILESSLLNNPAISPSNDLSSSLNLSTQPRASPKKALLDSFSSSKSPGQSLTTPPMYSINTKFLNDPVSSHSEGSYVAVPTDPQVIGYGSQIRLRFGGNEYLRMEERGASDRLGTPRNTTSTKVFANGDGIDGDLGQNFVILNPTVRHDRRAVRYGDIVALQCVGCNSKFFLSTSATSTVVAQRGPIISKSEKWMLLENYRRKTSSSLLPGSSSEEKEIKTGDRILLQSLSTSSYLVCVGEDVSDFSSQHHFSYSVKTPTSSRSTSDAVGTTLCLRTDDEVMGEPEVGVDLWEISKSSVPYNPAWSKNRPYLTGKHLYKSQEQDEEELLLVVNQELPPEGQENLLIEDLLFALLGIEGKYIRVSSDLKFSINNSGLNASLASLVEKILPICDYYVSVSQFIEQKLSFEFGQIAHAFSASVKSILSQYSTLVVQLESRARVGDLSLSMIWYYIQPSLRTFSLLHQVCTACDNEYGGALLSAIYRTGMSLGDSTSKATFSEILQNSTVPYMRMLEMWIYHGTVHDPYNEFMIEEDVGYAKEELASDAWCKYWENRYTIRESQVPCFLSRFKDRILTTGKYLNVVQETSHTTRGSSKTHSKSTLVYNSSDRYFEERINAAHLYASDLVVKLIMTENRLIDRLRSMKHYFLMDQGDFFVEFMDIAADELKIAADKASQSRLESLLHVALQTSTCASDAFNEDLTCFLSPHTLISQLENIHQRSSKRLNDPVTPFQEMLDTSLVEAGYKAIDALTLNYKVAWPLSLVISAQSLTKYQMIFRHLFLCKHVERRLCEAWKLHQDSKQFELRDLLTQSYALRQRMLHFQQNLGYFMMFEVVAPRWHELEKSLKTVDTIDDILNHHKDFLDNCLKECLLTDPELLRTLTRLMVVCMNFTTSIEKFHRIFLEDEEAIEAEREAQRERREEKRQEALQKGLLGSITSGGATTKKLRKSTLLRRRSSSVDLRRARIRAMSLETRKALTTATSDVTPEFERLTADFQVKFDTLLEEFMKKLLEQSHLQFNSHLSNLCTRLDYNGFYTNKKS